MAAQRDDWRVGERADLRVGVSAGWLVASKVASRVAPLVFSWAV